MRRNEAYLAALPKGLQNDPLRVFTEMLGRPNSEKPSMIIAVRHAAVDAKVPSVAKIKKPLNEILTFTE